MGNIRRSFTSVLIFVFFFSIKFNANAAPLSDLPGSVPLQDQRQAASDLVFQGKKLQPDEARALVASQKAKDLSFINPEEDSILWKDQYPKTNIDDLSTLELKAEGDEVEFINVDNAPSGRVVFIVQKRFADGRIKAYRFLLDDKAHNMLARKALLRKIGYNVPAMDRLKTVRVKFKGEHAKREFVNGSIKRLIFKDSARWITSDIESADEYVTFQDVVVFADTTDWFYNLARGNILPGVIQGRRVINSMLIPFTVTDAPESLNLMSWTGAQVFNQQALFPYEYAENFDPSLDDARWILRRMSNLNDKDWEQIADAAQMPPEPRNIYLEKMKARVNYAREILGMEKDGKDLNVNYKVTTGSRLTEGKLVGGRKWDGYARYFAGEDPESPLSWSEISGLLKSKFMTNVIFNTMSEFNKRYMPSTDLGFKIFDHQIDLSAKQFSDFLITGKPSKVPVGVWKTPFVNSQLIAAREIIAGNYLGADNMIQLADTIGFMVEGGNFYLRDGLSEKLSVTARAKVQLVMTYTHLKPVKSIKSSLKEPLSNIVVPYARYKATAPLENLLKLEARIRSGEFEGGTPEEQRDKKDKLNIEFKKEFDALAENLGPGESYIMNLSLAPGINFSVGKGLSADARAYLELQDRLVGMHRVHIYRKDEKTVQVYDDWAGYNELSAALGLKAKISIAELGFRWPYGKARTYFYQFNIDNDLEKNPEFFKEVTGVLAAVQGASRGFLTTLKKPWMFDHDFSDFRMHLNFLVWKNAKTNTTNQIEANHPEGGLGNYIRRTRAERAGREFEGLLLEVTNAILAEKYPDRDIRLSTNTAANPGDTIYGKSVTRQVVSEARVKAGAVDLDAVFAGVGYRWKGWEAKTANISNILDDMDRRFGERLFPRPLLNDTKKLQFYSIEIQTILYRRAFEHILRLSDAQVIDLFNRYGRQATAIDERWDSKVNSWATWLLGDLKKMRRAFVIGDTQTFADYLVDVVEVAESQLEFAGFKEFIGGKENLFVQGTMKGFRVNSEGQEDLRPTTLGRIGANEPLGPIYTLQKEIGISGGELLLHWLVNPL